jgi:hypothetical protein
LSLRSDGIPVNTSWFLECRGNIRYSRLATWADGGELQASVLLMARNSFIPIPSYAIPSHPIPPPLPRFAHLIVPTWWPVSCPTSCIAWRLNRCRRNVRYRGDRPFLVFLCLPGIVSCLFHAVRSDFVARLSHPSTWRMVESGTEFGGSLLETMEGRFEAGEWCWVSRASWLKGGEGEGEGRGSPAHRPFDVVPAPAPAPAPDPLCSRFHSLLPWPWRV